MRAALAASWARLERALPIAGHSVVRRSLVVTSLFLAGHAFYYLFIVGANRILDAQGFGRFYAAWAVLNILVAPGTIAGLVLTARLADTRRQGGDRAAVSEFRRILAGWRRWAWASVILAELLLYAAGALVGVESLLLVALLPLAAASIIAVELVRAAFHSMMRFVWSGVSWFACCSMRSILGLLGLAIVGAPWAGIGGLLLANLLLLPLLALGLRRAARDEDKPTSSTADRRLNSPGEILAFASAFTAFVVFCNADVLIAYVIMPGPALGIFSAAAVLPKAIVTATLPLTQVMLPVVVSIHGRVSERRLATAKAALLALALASACLAVLWGTSDLVGGGPFGIRSCEPQLMLLLGTAAIPLAILRTVVVADLGVGQYRIPHLPVLMLAVTVAGGLLLRPDAWQLAIGFAFSAWALLVVTVIAKATTWLRWKP